MTVLLVLTMFLAFILLESLLHRSYKPQCPVNNNLAYTISDYLIPEMTGFHSGHSWVKTISPSCSRIGIDEFASAIMGPIQNIELPAVGARVKQGEVIFKFKQNNKETCMVSPSDGFVTKINKELLQNPSMLRDAYGNGWCIEIKEENSAITKRNLVQKEIVDNWLSEATMRLCSFMPELAGQTAYDGGKPMYNAIAMIPGGDWEKITKEFFLIS